jgi:UDP-hydrolysing UDP-N-acetyl-D-glucosamine 2-epimerase
VSRRIGIVTGSRAEYGLLEPVIRGLRGTPGVDAQVYATGAHLSPEFGMTVREIEAEGVPVAERIEILLSSDSAVGVGKSLGLAVAGFAEAFARRAPDLVVILGDRYEAFGAAAAATVSRVPIAHIHGGELTRGAIDDAFRHAITKMSHLHFAAAAQYARRIIQMGEPPERVFTVGALGVEAALGLAKETRAELEAALGVRLGSRTAVVTFHPATADEEPADAQFQRLLDALDGIPDLFTLFTGANADAAGRSINALMERYAAGRPGRAASFASLGQRRYLSLLAASDLVIGNSSSGIIEAPSLGVPTVNIGDRQDGRARAPSVIDCGTGTRDIGRAIARALAPEFRAACARRETPYGTGGASRAIVDVLATAELGGLLAKGFVDRGG